MFEALISVFFAFSPRRQRIPTEDDGFHAAVAETLEEACKLIEVSFEFVCRMDNPKRFRKKKTKDKDEK
ncbi:MAG: hypothetical protein ACUVUE_00815 [Candidatus Bathycorpusculaceae bacterium]